MILLVDNFDSFTFNLAQALSTLGAVVEVRRNDAIDAERALRLAPRAIVLSPGPGRPEQAGATPEIVRTCAGQVPILGICLGHQAIAAAFGARIARAEFPLHGRATAVRHDGSGLFRGIAPGFLAGRYHSLAVVRETLPPELAVTAEDDAGTVLALAHRRLPLWGVQFHPESVLTPQGPRLLANFLTLAGAGPGP